jgi:DNA-binding NtrC family response regulator
VKPSILIVDDDRLVSDFMAETFAGSPYEVETADSGDAAAEKIAHRDYDLIFSDVKMPGLNGIELLKRIKKVSPETVVIMMTAFGTVRNAVEAMKSGAYEYLLKPFGPDEATLAAERALEHHRLVRENRLLRHAVAEKYSFARLVGKSAPMRRVYSLIESVADSRATVLITGESGTGKELVAKATHYHGGRKDGPFVALNCAALPETLIESELFGHEKGAFTNAVRQKRGHFEIADGGTLLLDEISEMPAGLQAKLLRVLQEREIQRLGSESKLPIDVRVIATSNRHLPTEIEAGNFREDLYYRLNVIPIHLPPLRERPEDIPALVEHFIARFNAENNRSAKQVSDKVLRLFEHYIWPGNVRELENYIERAVVVAKSDTLTPDDFPAELFTGGVRRQTETIRSGSTIRDMERSLILKTLEDQGGNQTKAADLLGISTRTLRNKLYEYGVKEAKPAEEQLTVDG